MLMSTPQLSRCRSLDNVRVRVQIEENTLERASTSKLLCSHLHQHLKWEDNVKAIGSSCYATLATLRKLKHVLAFNLRKTIVQSLVLCLSVL